MHVYGTVTSANATLTVTAPVAPAITVQPQSQSVASGQAATFSVSATGTDPLAYQWKKNGTAISGATAATYTTPATTAGDNGAAFSVVVSNAAGSVPSASATLTVSVGQAPAIQIQPVGQTGSIGDTATFTVAASGAGTLSYRWYKNNIPLLSNATASVYTTPTLTTALNGAVYKVVVTSSFGTVTSASATLTVVPYGTMVWKKDVVYLGTKEVAEVDPSGLVHTTLVDHLGSPRLVVNASGAVESEQKYLPFGEQLDASGSLKTLKGYTNHEQTDPSGLIYMQARFYAPMYHRFLSPDPARDQHFEETQSWNIYSYVQNQPMMATDPTGMIGDWKFLKDIYNEAKQNVTNFFKGLSNGVKVQGREIGSTLVADNPQAKKALGIKNNTKEDSLAHTARTKSGAEFAGQFFSYVAPLLIPVGGEAKLASRGAKAGELAELANGIATPHGMALQASSAEAQAALRSVKSGASLFRQGEFGIQKAGEAQFWSLQNPATTSGFAGQMGMPGGAGAGVDWVMSGSLKPGASVITRLAPGLGTNAGGSMEAVVKPGSIRIDWFHMP